MKRESKSNDKVVLNKEVIDGILERIAARCPGMPARASEGQKAFLRRLGVRSGALISREAASSLIEYELGKRR